MRALLQIKINMENNFLEAKNQIIAEPQKPKKILISVLLVLILVLTGTAVFLFFLTSQKTTKAEDMEISETSFLPKEKQIAFAPSEIILQFKDKTKKQDIDKFLKDNNFSVKEEIDKGGFMVLTLPKEKNPLEVSKELKNNALIREIEPNYYFYASIAPDDIYYKYQWNFKDKEHGGINMEQAWEEMKKAGVKNKTTVAVIDTGVFQGAPDFAGTNFTQGYNFVGKNWNANDDYGHGTHVAGTIAQATNNKIGVAGAAFEYAIIMPIKVLDYEGKGIASDIAKGIYYAADNGAKIINMSLGSSMSSQAIFSAINYAGNKGITMIAACGNSNNSFCDYPAGYSSVISVGATQYNGNKAPYSSYGPTLALAAPGGNNRVDENKDGYPDGILQQTFRKNGTLGYMFYHGTSMAAPHVSAVAAMVLAKNPNLNSNQIRTILTCTANDIGYKGRDDFFGWGLLNAENAIKTDEKDAKCPVMPGSDINIICLPNVSKECSGNNIYWFDSCGLRGDKAENCGIGFCEKGKCVTCVE